MRGLVLEAAKRRELALGTQHTLSFGLQVAAATAGERFEGGLVAPAFDEDGGAGVRGDHQVLRVVGRQRWTRAERAWRRRSRTHVRIMLSCSDMSGGRKSWQLAGAFSR